MIGGNAIDEITRNAAPRRTASPAAHSTADDDVLEPSNPTTTRSCMHP
jgi:hypothetical protein